MDPLRNALQSMYTNTKAAYDKIDEMGGELPANKNLQNLAEAIRSIPTGPLPPGVPTTLEELKEMINKGREIVTGTEIPDMYNGQSNPLIVAQNLNNTNNSAYGGAEGVILVRKHVDPTSQLFSSYADYSTSLVKDFLDTTYLDNCSDTLKSIISEIDIPYNNTTVKSKFFLMSDTEVCAIEGDNIIEGMMWDYWKQKTGLSSPNNNNNDGRIMKDRNGTAQTVWLRSRSSSTQVNIVYTTGSINRSYVNVSYGVIPACFIGKD